jgi:glutamyl-tRNA reductase
MMFPTLFLIGATHRTAPFGLREKLALGTEGEATLAAELSALATVREFAILNTCNRVEIYGVATHPLGARQVADTFCALRHIERAAFATFGLKLEGPAAVEHLLSVASGLDSQILGETEIFGQVKRAYAAAQTRRSAGAILNRLFQKAFQAAKHVRTHAGVSNGQVSIANVAVDLAETVFGRLSEARVLVLGAGEMGEKSAKAFQSRGATDIHVASRHRERAEELARALAGATVVDYEQREFELARADIVVCSTAAPHAIVSLPAAQAALARRRARPLLFLDLAMPRNVDAAVAALDNTFVYNLDDLAAVAAKNRQARAAQAAAGRAALVPRAASLWQQLQLQLTTLPSASEANISPGLLLALTA